MSKYIYVDCPKCGHFFGYSSKQEDSRGTVVLKCARCGNLFGLYPVSKSVISHEEDVDLSTQAEEYDILGGVTAPVDDKEIIEKLLEPKNELQ